MLLLIHVWIFLVFYGGLSFDFEVVLDRFLFTERERERRERERER